MCALPQVPEMAFGEYWDTCEYTDGVLNYNQVRSGSRSAWYRLLCCNQLMHACCVTTLMACSFTTRCPTALHCSQ